MTLNTALPAGLRVQEFVLDAYVYLIPLTVATCPSEGDVGNAIFNLYMYI